MNTFVRKIAWIAGTAAIVIGLALGAYIFVTRAEAKDTSDNTETAVAVAATAAVNTEVTESTTKLQAIVDDMSAQYGTNIGLVVEDLSNGVAASYNSDTQFVSASIYKLFVAYSIYQQIDSGQISLSDTVTVGGASRTIDYCLEQMLTVSDNACAVALGNEYGWANLDSMLANAGYNQTQLNNYDSNGTLISDKQTTASDVAKLLLSLYKGTLVSASSTTSFIDYLKADAINYMLPSGLPEGTVIAHKVGYLEDYQHDAGIIYGTGKDVLVVMLTKGWSTPVTQASAAFAQLAQSIWTYMSE